MDAPAEHVYCYRRGSEDCFKIGRTAGSPEKRKAGFATGSPVKLTLYRDERTEDSAALEAYIHELLDAKRTENGEFFSVTATDLDDAVDRAVAFMLEFQPLDREADRLSREMPGDAVKKPTRETLDAYRKLRQLRRERDIIDREIELLKRRIQVAIGNCAAMEGAASWEWVERWTLDIDRFKSEQPQLYEQYKRNSGCRVFRLDRVDLTQDLSMTSLCVRSGQRRPILSA